MFIAAVEISGRISRRSVNEYSQILDYVRDKNKVGGLLMIINSEGGDANSSEILYNKITEIKKRKPVYAVIESIGASGAYWVASASTKIFAMDTSLVGSIGVISLIPNVSKLLEKIGVTVEVDKIGEFKDMVSPFSEMTPEAREKYRLIMENAFNRFRDDVKVNRSIPDSSDDDVFNGQIFSSRDAMENGLIDSIGDSSAAVEDLAKALSIPRKVRLFSPRKPFISRLFGTEFMQETMAKLVNRL